MPRSSYTVDLTVRPALESETQRMSAALSDNFEYRFSLQKWFIQGGLFFFPRAVRTTVLLWGTTAMVIASWRTNVEVYMYALTKRVRYK